MLLRLHEMTGGRRHLAAVREVVEWLVSGEGAVAEAAEDGHRGWSAFNDILFGDAGTALFPLEAAGALDDDRERAAEAGRALVARGMPEHGELYWVLREGGTSNLPNFSHGAAGVGYLMTRLYEATGDSTFLDAALGAAAYDAAIADTTGGVLRVPYGMDLAGVARAVRTGVGAWGCRHRAVLWRFGSGNRRRGVGGVGGDGGPGCAGAGAPGRAGRRPAVRAGGVGAFEVWMASEAGVGGRWRARGRGGARSRVRARVCRGV